MNANVNVQCNFLDSTSVNIRLNSGSRVKELKRRIGDETGNDPLRLDLLDTNGSPYKKSRQVDFADTFVIIKEKPESFQNQVVKMIINIITQHYNDGLEYIIKHSNEEWGQRYFNGGDQRYVDEAVWEDMTTIHERFFEPFLEQRPEFDVLDHVIDTHGADYLDLCNVEKIRQKHSVSTKVILMAIFLCDTTNDLFHSTEAADTGAVVKLQALWRGYDTRRFPYVSYYVNVHECENCGHSSYDEKDIECPFDQGGMYTRTIRICNPNIRRTYDMNF